MDEFLTRVTKSLNKRKSQVHAEWEARPAAVLVPLYFDNDEWHMLFTRRTESVNEHRGQVSFPGGAIEESDQDPTQTALREVEEEIGIPATDIEIVGALDPLLTVTQFHITPIVGVIPWPFEFVLNPAEVARVFGVPIKWLTNPNNLTTEYRDPLISGPPIPIYYFKTYDDEIIWGATARIILNFFHTIQEK